MSMIAQTSADHINFITEFGPLSLIGLAVWALVSGHLVPRHVLEGVRHRADRMEDQIRVLSEARLAVDEAMVVVEMIKAEPVPFDPDYAVIGKIRPEFTDSGDLKWYRSDV
jgi:hypothetical protein